MFLSKVYPPKNFPFYKMHQFVMSGFPDNFKERVLWREEDDCIVVQSSVKPTWDCRYEVRDYNPQFQNGQVLRFKIVVNPTRYDPISGKRVGIYKDDDLVDYFIRQAEKNGFAIQPLFIEKPEKKTDNKKDGVITFASVSVRGVLKINNVELFNEAIKNGIGRSKSFGCGMLCVTNKK